MQSELAVFKTKQIFNKDCFKFSAEVEIMDSDEDESVPMVQVGHRSIPITDINDQIISEMTPSEKELYIQIYQDHYSHIYD